MKTRTRKRPDFTKLSPQEHRAITDMITRNTVYKNPCVNWLGPISRWGPYKTITLNATRYLIDIRRYLYFYETGTHPSRGCSIEPGCGNLRCVRISHCFPYKKVTRRGALTAAQIQRLHDDLVISANGKCLKFSPSLNNYAQKFGVSYSIIHHAATYPLLISAEGRKIQNPNWPWLCQWRQEAAWK